MDFAKYADLSEKQKGEFLELAGMLVAYSVKARNEGLLALDDDLAALETETKGRRFFKKMLTFIVEGVDSTLIRQIGESYIQHDRTDGFERLALDMVLRGALSIQSGDNPWILIEILSSFTGIVESEFFREQLENVLDEVDKPFAESGRERSVDREEEQAEEGTTISQDEIDAFLCGSAEKGQD